MIRKLSFSERRGLSKKRPLIPVKNDAPEWARKRFVEDILISLLYIDGDSRYSNEGRPLPAKELHRKFRYLLREEVSEEDSDSWHCIESLNDHLLACEWHAFFDFVELVDGNLKETNRQSSKYSVESFREKTNELFRDESVVWRLGEDGELHLPPEDGVADQEVEFMDNVESDSAAISSFDKARGFLRAFPPDPENCVKECITMLESLGKERFPKSKTFGDVIKEIKKTGEMPGFLVGAVEKIWIFSNSAPAIRHGSSEKSELSIDEANYCYGVCLSFSNYLVGVLPLGDI